ERWQMARDLALELEWIAESSQGVSAPLVRSRRNRERLAWSLAVLASVLLASFVIYQRFSSSSPSVVVSDIAAPKGTKYNSLVNGRAAISPDGRAVVFAARDASGSSSVWVRALDGSPAQLIPETANAAQPFWSPDSRRIGFVQNSKLIVVDASGGPSVPL